MDTSTQPGVVRFGPYEVDLRAAQVRKRGVRLRLAGQPFVILQMLLERPGDIVTRGELRARLWPEDTFVEFDHSLNAAVNKLREVLGDSADQPRYVETVPRRGYRFIAEVTNGLKTNGANGHAAAEAPPATAALPAAASPARGLRLALAAVIFLGVVAAAAYLLRGPADGPPTVSAPIRSIAVLPFDNLSGDPEQEYFADGMTDAVISQLAQIGALRVISRTSVIRYRGQSKAVPEIARELNVDAVIEGAVQRDAGRVRISAQLIRGSTDEHLWAQVFERDLDNLLALQNEVAAAVAQRIRVQLTAEERVRLAASRSVRPDAYQAYLMARYYQKQSVPHLHKRAMPLYEEAVAKDPQFAPARAGLAEMALLGRPPRESMARARAEAERAVELDPASAEAHAALGKVLTMAAWDWAGAERALRRSIELNPNYAEAHQWYSQLLSALGRHDEAIREARTAFELDPFSPLTSHFYGRVLYFARRYDEAVAQYRHAIELDDGNFYAHFFLFIALESRERFEEAMPHVERSMALQGATPAMMEEMKRVYAAQGYPGLWRVRLRMTEEKVRLEGISSVAIPILYARLGEKQRALDWLERAFEARTRDLIFLQVEPQFDSLRDDPRFQALLQRMNFPR